MKKYLMILFVFCGLSSMGNNLYITVVGNNFGAPIKGIGVSIHEPGLEIILVKQTVTEWYLLK